MAKKAKYSLTLTLAMLISIIIVACKDVKLKSNKFSEGGRDVDVEYILKNFI